MGVSEKLAPKYLSLGATLAGVGVCAFLFFRGEQNPRLYTSNMAYNAHSGYDRIYGCQECHVPGGGFFLTPTCMTSSCHGELISGKSPEENVAYMMEYWQTHNKIGKTEKKALSYLTTHANYRIDECATCHSEHTPHPKPEEAMPGEASLRLTHTASLLESDG